MLAEKAENPSLTQTAHRATFFRQSGWLMIANIGGGVLMWAVHLLNQIIPPGEYGSFGAFLAVVMVLPTIPLQMVMAQQTARCLALRAEAQLSGLIRLVLWATFLCWLAGTALVLVLQRSILEHWQLSDPVGLWVTLPIVLFSLWGPVLLGVLQGQQNFFWLGWSALANGIVRLTVAALAVRVLHIYAAGMMGGVLLGSFVAFAIGAWYSRSLWRQRPEPADWRGLLHQIAPLLLGFLGFQILFTADTMFVKAYFPKATVDFYVGAGTLSRALMWLVLPLAAVMFPRLVHSATRGEKTDLMGMVFLGTAVLGVAGAGGLCLVGPWVVKLIYPRTFLQVASLLPWYGFAMVPLALGNVLLNDLLARPASKLFLSVTVLVLSLAYMFALTQFHGSLVAVLKTMGLFNLLLLAICAWFTWGAKVQSPKSKVQSPIATA
jgi:O-antigen/teichoic acid export membrane protein